MTPAPRLLPAVNADEAEARRLRAECDALRHRLALAERTVWLLVEGGHLDAGRLEEARGMAPWFEGRGEVDSATGEGR